MRYVSTYYIHSLANCALLITILLCALFAGFSIYKKNDFFKELAKKVGVIGVLIYCVLLLAYYILRFVRMLKPAVIIVATIIIIALAVMIISSWFKKK